MWHVTKSGIAIFSRSVCFTLLGASLLGAATGCASSERMTRMSGGTLAPESAPKAERLSRPQVYYRSGAELYETLQTQEVGGIDDTLVNIWPIFYRNRAYWSLFWPMVDCDPYGFAIRPFYNQEGDEYSVLFPLAAWNPVNGDGWVLNTFWTPQNFVSLPFLAVDRKDGSVWCLNSYFSDSTQVIFPIWIRLTESADWSELSKSSQGAGGNSCFTVSESTGNFLLLGYLTQVKRISHVDLTSLQAMRNELAANPDREFNFREQELLSKWNLERDDLRLENQERLKAKLLQYSTPNDRFRCGFYPLFNYTSDDGTCEFSTLLRLGCYYNFQSAENWEFSMLWTLLFFNQQQRFSEDHAASSYRLLLLLLGGITDQSVQAQQSFTTFYGASDTRNLSAYLREFDKPRTQVQALPAPPVLPDATDDPAQEILNQRAMQSYQERCDSQQKNLDELNAKALERYQRDLLNQWRFAPEYAKATTPEERQAARKRYQTPVEDVNNNALLLYYQNTTHDRSMGDSYSLVLPLLFSGYSTSNNAQTLGCPLPFYFSTSARYSLNWTDNDAPAISDAVSLKQRYDGELQMIESSSKLFLLNLLLGVHQEKYLLWNDTPEREKVKAANDALNALLNLPESINTREAYEKLANEAVPGVSTVLTLNKPLKEYSYAELRTLQDDLLKNNTRRASYHCVNSPFFRFRDFEDESGWDVLWPLFRGYRQSNGREAVRILEYCYRYDKEEDRENLLIFPFYSRQKEGNRTRCSFLYRILSFEYEDDSLTGGHIFFLPF